MTQFIHQQFLKDVSICERLIQAHKDSPHKCQGKTSGGLDTAKKDSTDSPLENPLLLEYAIQLQDIVDEYIELHPQCNANSAWTTVEGINFQHYHPHGGYKVWHCERGSIEPKQAARQLVFMTYLNDVTDGGGTEFLAQKLTIGAEKGKTVIWPADWTHTHRGIVSPTQDKYIVTGWFSFTE
jgi:hypothetical protein